MIDFQFAQTKESEAFLLRHPTFHEAFYRIIQLSNQTMGSRSVHSRLEDVCHRLANTCRGDYLESFFLGMNGYGTGATKLLRGLYERAVTLAYILKYPEKVDRFVHYGAITEYKTIEQARKLFSDEEIDAVLRDNSVTDVKKRFDEFKGEFVGKKNKVAISWERDFASLVRDVGEPFQEYYLSAYLLPNSDVHATVACLIQENERQERKAKTDFTLTMANAIFLKVIELHKNFFNLGLDAELKQCMDDFVHTWLTPQMLQNAKNSV
jgi:hypothetical protein